MQAILLAGGLGTRLRSVVSDRPKPMALIEGRPFMEYVVHELSRHGITHIIFAVGYKGSMVEEYFGDGSSFGVTVSYAYEETLLGTAGAIKNAGKFITEDTFYVLNADTFTRLTTAVLPVCSRKKIWIWLWCFGKFQTCPDTGKQFFRMESLRDLTKNQKKAVREPLTAEFT